MSLQPIRLFVPAASLLCLMSAIPVRAQDSPLPFSETVDMIAEMIRCLTGEHSSTPTGERRYAERSIQLQPGYAPRGHESHGSPGYGPNSLPSNYPRYSDEIDSRPLPPSHDQPCRLCYKVDQSAVLCTTVIKFRKNSTELADHGSVHYLHNLAAALQDPALARDRFVIEGHASAEGNRAVNQILSQERANAICDFLVSHGVHPSRLLAVGMGETQARHSSSAADYLRATDRRVMIIKLAP